MATVSVTPQRTGKINSLTAYTYAAVGAGDTVKIAGNFREFQALILVKNGAAETTFSVSAGNGLAGVNGMEKKIAANAYGTLNLDSSRFMNVTGADKGKIVLTVDKACDIAVVEQGLTLQTNPNA